MTRSSTVTTAMICLLYTLACGGDKPTEWSRAPLTETPETVKGVAFAILLPGGLTAARTDNAITWTARRGAASGPRVRVELSEQAAPAYVEDATQRALAGLEGHAAYRTSQIADGFAIVHHNADKTTIGVATYRKLADQRTLACTAEITPSKSPGLDAMANWLQNICVSLDIERKRKAPAPPAQ